MSNLTENLTESGYLYITNGYQVFPGFFVMQLAIILSCSVIIAINIMLVVAVRRTSRSDGQCGPLVTVLPLIYGSVGLFGIWNALYNLTNVQNITECLVRYGFVHTIATLISLAMFNLVLDR